VTDTLVGRTDEIEPSAGPAPSPAVAPGPIVTRRRLEIALGCLWLLDGLLQFQPYMFTRSFFQDILGMANMGLPGVVGDWDYRAANILGSHFVLWNAAFATLQVLLGIGLLRRSSARAALAISIPWSLAVWVLGEGFGAMFMPGTGLLTGAPGAALLYALLALLLWPRHDDVGGSVADHGLLGPRVAGISWAAVWIGSALLELEAVNHAPSVPAAQLTNTGQGEPSFIASINHWFGSVVGGQGLLFAIAVGTTGLLVGAGIFVPKTRRLAIGLGLVAAVYFGTAGQDLGGILTGHGTDPGTGPPLVLLALALWPRRSAPASGAPGTVAGAAATARAARADPDRHEREPGHAHAGL
jgi:hypothetical protein